MKEHNDAQPYQPLQPYSEEFVRQNMPDEIGFEVKTGQINDISLLIELGADMSRRFNRAFVMKTNFPMSVSSAGLKEFKEKNRTDDLNDPPSLALIGAMERDPQTGLDYFCVYLLRVDVRRGGISDVRICDITRVQNEATKGDTNASMVLDELLNKRNWAIFNSYSKSFEKRPQHENHYEIQSEKRLERRLP